MLKGSELEGLTESLIEFLDALVILRIAKYMSFFSDVVLERFGASRHYDVVRPVAQLRGFRPIHF